MLFPHDAILAGEAVRAGLLGGLAEPDLGVAALLALTAPLILWLAARLRETAAELTLAEERPRGAEAPALDAAGRGRLRLVAGVCAAIGALFAFVAAEALGVVPLHAMAGLLVGAVGFSAFAARCWGLSRQVATEGRGRR